jgi:hypothetical protein
VTGAMSDYTKSLERPSKPDESLDAAITPDDWLKMAGRLCRGVGLTLVLVLFMFGVWNAFQVFWQVQRLVTDPAQAGTSVDTIANLIDAENITFSSNGQAAVKLGRAVSFAFLLMLYIVWVWVPMVIIGTTGRLLLAGFDRKPPPPRK